LTLERRCRSLEACRAPAPAGCLRLCLQASVLTHRAGLVAWYLHRGKERGMTNLWTWGGEYFGYREGDSLWTHDGRHVGQFQGSDVFGRDGGYLGELMNGDRLIRSRSKKSTRGGSFAPYGRRVGVVKSVNYVGNVMYAGYEDFPSPSAV
jgi:hypothetical protein